MISILVVAQKMYIHVYIGLEKVATQKNPGIYFLRSIICLLYIHTPFVCLTYSKQLYVYVCLCVFMYPCVWVSTGDVSLETGHPGRGP